MLPPNSDDLTLATDPVSHLALNLLAFSLAGYVVAVVGILWSL